MEEDIWWNHGFLSIERCNFALDWSDWKETKGKDWYFSAWISFCEGNGKGKWISYVLYLFSTTWRCLLFIFNYFIPMWLMELMGVLLLLLFFNIKIIQMGNLVCLCWNVLLFTLRLRLFLRIRITIL